MPTLSLSDQLANRRKQQLKYDDIVAANTARSIRLGVVNAPRSNSAEVNSRRTARELDAPTQVVQALPDRAEQELKVRRRVNAARQAPRLAGVLSDPYTTTFAEDDLQEMVRLSTTAQKSGSFQDISRAYSAGRFNLGQPSALAPRKTLKEEYVDDALVEGGFFNLEKSLVGLTLAGAEKLNSLRTFFGLSELENIKELRKGAFLAGDVLDKEVAKRVDGDNAAQRGIKQGLASIQTSAFSLAIGRGRPVFTASAAGTLTGGSSYLTARSQGLDEDSALTYAAIDGTIEALTEVGPLKALLDRTPVGSTLGKRISNYLAREQIGEQVATAGQDFNAWVFLPENKDKTFGDYLAERPEAAAETFFAALTSSAVQGGTVGAVQRVADIAIRRASRAQSSLEDAQAIDNIMDSAAKHKMREADPQAFEEYVASQTQGTPAENIYIPAEAVDTYLQSEYATELAERAPEVLEAINEQLEEARAVNGDIVIPTSRAATLLAGTQFWEAIKADARIDAGGLSPRELENSGDEVQRTFEELGGKIYAQAVEQLNTDSATQQVFEEVRAQLSEIGFSNKAAEEQATLYAANRAAMGARFGLDAVQYHEANPVEFRRAGINDAQSGEGKVFNQPQGSETGQEVQSAPISDGEPQTTTAGSTAPTDIGDTALPEITKEQIDKAASDVAPEEVTPIVQLRQTSPTNEPTPQILEVSEIRDKAAKVANNVPGFSSMLPYLSDEELQGLRKQSAEKMMRIFSELPSADETASVAFSGRAKRGWYERSAQTLVDIFGAKDATRFAALLAALSPQTSVEANAINALNVWVNWDARKRPTDRQAILNIMADSVQGDKGLGSVLTAWIDNSMRALQTQDVTGLKLSGPKVNSFWLNLVGVVDEVTNDTWMANYSLMEAQLLQGVKKQGLLDKGPGYKALSAATRRAAEILSNRTGDTWTPAEVQETVWSWVKTLTEKRAGTGAVTAQDILAAGGLTQEDIGNTPDFAQLFTRGVYRRILETGGYSAEIFALESSGQAAPPPNPEGQVTDAEGSGVDIDTFQRHLNAAAARVDFRYVERYGPPSVDNQLDMFSIDHVANRFSPANISNLLKHNDWAVLTAENPNGQQATDKANARAMRNLRADMTAMGLEFKEAIGKYGQIENSFVVVGITRSEADRLGRKYGQESVLTRDGFLYQDGTMNPVSDGVQTFDERPEDFFTEIPSLGTKFAIGIDFDTRVKADSVDTVRVLNQAAADGEIISDHQYRRVKANSTLVDIRQADDGTLLWVAERGSINLGHIPRELESNGYPGEAVLPDDPRLENSTPVLIKTPPVIDGKITLQHFSGVAGLDTLDPTRWGSNAKFLPKSERERVGIAPPRTYFGIETGKAGGYVNEFSGDSVVEYTAQVDADRLYDIGSDPENLREGTSGGGFEQAVLDAGYIGYWHQNNYLGLVAVVFEPTQASQVSNVNTQSPDAPTLGGLPKVSPGRFKTARTAAAEYAKNAGIEYRGLDEYAPLDTDRAARIADEYERMEHKPNDPEVRAAYNAMVEETLAQWQEIKKTGLTAEFVTGDDPYGGSPWGAIRDVRDNNHMWVFSTEDGYGQSGITAEMEAENPMLALVPDETFGGKPVRVNDIFRVVHDYFGHVKEGFGFRARGEENAWRSHSLMFSPLARRALTTETRGQNSWLNYGPHGETNRTASVEDTVFAEQKIGLMAEWTSDINADPVPETIDIDGVSRPTTDSKGRRLGATEKAIRNFWKWFGDSEVVDADGKPLVVYHGTNKDIQVFDRKRVGFASAFGIPVEQERYGSFFAVDRAFAESYSSENVIEVYLSIENSFDMREQNIQGLLDSAEGQRIEREAEISIEGIYQEYEYDRWENFDEYDLPTQLKKAGFDGAIMNERDESGESAKVWVAFDPTQIKSAVKNSGEFSAADPIIFNQKNKPTVRGQVAFYPDRKVITLFEDADMSTLLHETGHIFVEELAKNATAKGAPKDVKADWAAVKSWLKKNGHTVRGSNIPREAHELLARGFERYLMEGKAPSSQLESAFATFRGWLINIYRNVLKLRSPITPEIRDVFGRMLATDQAIEEYTNEQSAQPLIKDKPDGMTEAEFNSFRDSALAARDNAQAQLIKKVTEQLRKSKNAARRDAMQSAKDEAEETVNAEPRFIALHLLRTGRWLSGEGNNPGNTKLDYAWVVQRYGEDALNKLPNGKIVKKDGEDAEYIAELTGFNSADDMMQALFDMKEQQDRMTADGDRRQLRDRMIDETAQEILGENPATSDIDLEEEAIAAVQNEKQGELITKEARYLARGTGQTPTPYRLARAWAARKIQSGLVQEVASKAAVYRYSRAAAKSAKLAEEAYIVDDFAGAYRHKQAQIINHALFMEARIAKDRVVTIERRMKRLAKRKAMKSVDQDYMDKIHVMLEAFDFRPRTNKFLEQQEEFHRWAAEQAAQGFEVNVPPKLVTQGTHYTRATLETLYGFDDTVQSLLELGRLRQNIVDAEEERKLGEYIDEAVANIAELPAKISDTSINPDNRVVASAMAPLLKIETMADDLDNGNSNGPFNRLLVHRASDAENVRAALRERTLKPIAEAYLGMPAQHRKRLEEKITISEFPHRGGELDPRNGDPVIMTRMELLSVALNSGNMSNLEKMAKGEGWEISDIQSVLNRELQKEDWDFVQTVWDSLQSMWPDIAATERRLSGVVPEQVDVLPVETPFGTYRGGYYPVVYDPDRAQFAENNAANEANDLFGMASGIATPKGHTITRTGAVGPIYRSVEGVLFNHVEKVITRVAYAEYARDVLRVVNNSRVRNALDLKFGKEYRRQIRPWLQRSINAGSVDTRGLAWWERMMRSVRINTTLVAMGFRVSTGLAQVAGLTASAARIGPVKVAQGIRQLLIERGDAVEFVMSRSPEMARRNNEVNRDIADAFKQLRGKNGPVDRARAMAFWHIGMIDRYIVAVPTWLGAHSQGIEQGMTDEQASRYADKSVRQSQGSGQEKDLANWQSPTGETMRWLTLFYTYFNVQLNSQWEAVRNTKKGQYQKAAQLSFWFMMAAPLVDALISGDLPDEKDDPEAWANWFARNVFFGLFSGIPVARDVAAYGERKMSGQYATLGSTPLLRTLDVGERAAVLASKAATGEELPDNTVKIMVETPGYFLGLPTGQASGTSQFLWDYSNGEVDPKTFNDWYWGLSKGKIPEEKK